MQLNKVLVKSTGSLQCRLQISQSTQSSISDQGSCKHLPAWFGWT